MDDDLNFFLSWRMGRLHGHAKVIDMSSAENEKVIYDGKFLNGRPMEAGDDLDDDERMLLFKKIRIFDN